MKPAKWLPIGLILVALNFSCGWLDDEAGLDKQQIDDETGDGTAASDDDSEDSGENKLDKQYPSIPGVIASCSENEHANDCEAYFENEKDPVTLCNAHRCAACRNKDLVFDYDRYDSESYPDCKATFDSYFECVFQTKCDWPLEWIEQQFNSCQWNTDWDVFCGWE